jgi:hypothetical protein
MCAWYALVRDFGHASAFAAYEKCAESAESDVGPGGSCGYTREERTELAKSDCVGAAVRDVRQLYAQTADSGAHEAHALLERVIHAQFESGVCALYHTFDAYFAQVGARAADAEFAQWGQRVCRDYM